MIYISTNHIISVHTIHTNMIHTLSFHLSKLIGTNRDRSELFVAAVRSSSGDTVPVNMTIIPSGQKWVFDTIYKFAFPYLYQANICKMNRMVLTDEDESRRIGGAFHTNDIPIHFRHISLETCDRNKSLLLEFGERLFS